MRRRKTTIEEQKAQRELKAQEYESLVREREQLAITLDEASEKYVLALKAYDAFTSGKIYTGDELRKTLENDQGKGYRKIVSGMAHYAINHNIFMSKYFGDVMMLPEREHNTRRSVAESDRLHWQANIGKIIKELRDFSDLEK